jgi:hypothetical protein
MAISAISSSTSTYSSYQSSQADPLNKIKKDFEGLGDALSSGNLSDAQTAFAQLLKDSPTDSSGSNPMSADINKLGQALDSGDMETAQEIYGQMEEKISQGPPSGGVSGAVGAQTASTSGSGSQSTSSIYDKKDANQDGIVTAAEEIAYNLEHLDEVLAAQQDSQGYGNSGNSVGNIVDTVV